MFRKTTFALVLILSIILFADGLYLLSYKEEERPPAVVRNDETTNQVQLLSEPQPHSPVNLLVLGLDGEEVRSDVILLMNLDPASKTMNILSIERDTRVEMHGKEIKINALIAIGGEELVAEEIENLTGLPVNYYLTLNFKGFRQIIDTLDGVNIYVPFDMDYDDPDQNLHIHLRKGYQHLSGKKAEGFVRYRKGNSPGEGYREGDIGRIKAQQAFLKALMEQKLKLKYITKLNEVFFILKNHMHTNIELGDIRQYLGPISSMDTDSIRSFTLPGDSAYINHTWFFINDAKKTGVLIENNFFR